MFEIDLVGNWNAASTALKRLPRDIRSAAIAGQRSAAEKYVRAVVKNIETSRFSFPGKEYNSSDPRAWINDHNLINEITSWRSGGVYFAGVKSGTSAPGKSIDFSTIALILEEGGGNGVPPRPVFSKTFKKFGGTRKVKSIIVNKLNTRLSRMGYAGFRIKKFNL